MLCDGTPGSGVGENSWFTKGYMPKVLASSHKDVRSDARVGGKWLLRA